MMSKSNNNLDYTKEQLIDFLENTTWDVQSCKISTVMFDIAYKAYAQMAKDYGVDYDFQFAFTEDMMGTQFTSEEKVFEVSRKIYEEFIKDESSLQKLSKDRDEVSQRIESLGKRFLDEKEKLSDDEFLKSYRQYVKVSTKSWSFSLVGEDKGKVADQELRRVFSKNKSYNQEKINDFVSLLAHSFEQSKINLERKNFFELCLNVLNNKTLKKSITNNDLEQIKEYNQFILQCDKYVESYYYKNSNFYTFNKYDLNVLIKEIAEEIKKEDIAKIKKNIEDINIGFELICKKKKELMNSVEFTSEEKKHIRYLEWSIQWVDLRKVSMMKQLYFYYAFMQEIGKRLGKDYDDIVCFTVDEIDDILSKKIPYDKEKASKRHGPTMMIRYGCVKTVVYYGKDALDLYEAGRKIPDDKSQVKGFVACKGKEADKFNGIVSLMLNSDKDVFTEGNILVTSMTRIEFVPFMKKAKAIITDEGGIACHAAVVSRELGIPCIVGTKNATNIFKDGDMIEVDADKGVVRLLERKTR